MFFHIKDVWRIIGQERVFAAMIIRASIIPFLAVFLCCSGCASTEGQTADLVLYNARVYTVDSNQPWAQAIAIKDRTVLYVGPDNGVDRFVGDHTKLANLDDRLVLPGLIDGHTHPGYIGVERFEERLPASSHEDLIDAALDRSERRPGKDWLRLCCWNPREYVRGRKGPHKSDLDDVVPDRPVWINSRSWHSYWLNSKALEVLGIDDDTPDPRRGVAVYDRDENGQLTGWVKEGAGWQHFSNIFKIDSELHRKSMLKFLTTLSEYGVTTVYDGGNFGYEDEVYSFLAELEQEGSLHVRYEGTYQVFTPERKDIAISEMRRLDAEYGGDLLRFRTIKLFMDGINANRTGALLQPYVDIPDFTSQTMLATEELTAFLLELHDAKLDLHIHTIGDGAVRSVLDAVEAAQSAIEGPLYPRVTLAHLNLVSPEDITRFKELGVSANYTAWWHRFRDLREPDTILGNRRMERLFGAKELIDAGANVTFSSDDWRLDVITPFLGMETGHIRRAPQTQGSSAALVQHEIGPENPTLEEMIFGYTLAGAYPFRMENEIGSIEIGKIADFIVLDEDLFEIEKNKIHTLKPSVVIMNGRVLHGELPN